MNLGKNEFHPFYIIEPLKRLKFVIYNCIDQKLSWNEAPVN